MIIKDRQAAVDAALDVEATVELAILALEEIGIDDNRVSQTIWAVGRALRSSKTKLDVVHGALEVFEREAEQSVN